MPWNAPFCAWAVATRRYRDSEDAFVRRIRAVELRLCTSFGSMALALAINPLEGIAKGGCSVAHKKHTGMFKRGFSGILRNGARDGV